MKTVLEEEGYGSVAEYCEELDEEIEKAEEKSGMTLSSISGWKILTDGSVPEDVGDNDTLSDAVHGIRIFRVIMWIFYGMAVLICILLVSGYFLRWNKYILSIVAAVYGVGGATLFGYLFWGIPGRIISSIPEEWQETLPGDMVSKVIRIAWKVIRGNSLLITFILLLVLFVVSVLSMLLFNRSRYGLPSMRIPGMGMGLGAVPNGLGPVNTGLVNPTPVNTMPVNPAAGGFMPEIPSPRQDIPPALSVTVPGDPFFFNNNQNTVPVNPMPLQNPVPEFQRQPFPEPAPIQQKAMGSVRCTQGAAKGQGFQLPEGRKVVVGKSPQRATLVINNPHISNVHCSIRYHAGKNTYVVKDHSTNGTFVNGVGLQKEVAVECPAGTVLSLADGKIR